MKLKFKTILSTNATRSIGVFLLFCSLSLSTVAQQQQQNFKDSAKIELLKNYVQWSYNYGSQKEFDSVNKYLSKALDLEKELDNVELSALVYLTHAEMFFWQANTEQSHLYVNKNISNNLVSDSLRVQSHLLKSKVLLHEQLHKQALEQAISAQQILLAHKVLSSQDSLDLSNANIKMAYVQKEANHKKKALFHYDEALKYCNDPGLKTYYNYYKAEILKTQQNLLPAIVLVKQSLKTAKERNLKVYLPTYYLALSDYYLQLKKADSALFYSKAGLQNNIDCHIDGLNFNAGLSYLELKDHPAAIAYFKDALKAPFSEIPSANIHKILGETYKLNGNYSEALFHTSAYATLQDSINEAKSKQDIYEISEKYQSEKKSLEIDMLQLKDQSSQEVISKQKTVLALMFTSLVLTLLLAGFILKYYLKQKRQRSLLFYKNLQLVRKLKRAELKNELIETEKVVRKSNSTIDDKKRASILKKIEAKIVGQFYLDKHTSLISFAHDIDTNTTYLSKIINDKFHKPFTHFVNDLRIQFMLQKIENDEAYRTYTIEYISEDVGFASSSAFYSAFKKNTGLTPSYYIKKRVKEVA